MNLLQAFATNSVSMGTKVRLTTDPTGKQPCVVTSIRENIILVKSFFGRQMKIHNREKRESNEFLMNEFVLC